MTPYELFLLGVVGVLAVIGIVALKFPRGRGEWPLDARQTVWLLVSGSTGIAVFALLWVATRETPWPDLVTSTFAVAALGTALLAGIAVFLPQGLRSRP